MGSPVQPKEVSNAVTVLDRFTQVAREMQVATRVLAAAQRDFDETSTSYRLAAKQVAKLCEELGVKPRGGPGTFSL
jgi:hypothetical protein